MTIHELKTWPEFFEPLYDGTKTFEVRKNDRGFRVGDRLRLREWEVPEVFTGQEIEQGYTGRELLVEVTFIMADADTPLMSDLLAPNHVVMAIALVTP